MNDPTGTFLIPEEYLAQRRHFMAVMGGIMVVALLLVTLSSLSSVGFKFDPVFLPWVLLPVVPLIVLLGLQSRYIIGQYRQMRLHIGPEGIVREAGAVRQVVPWDKITRVRIHHNPRGEVRFVEVSAAGHRPLTLFGFAPMAEIAEKIQSGVPPTARVITKRYAVDWENPLVMALRMAAVVFVTLLVIEAVRRLGGPGLYHKFIHVFGVVFGVAFGIFLLVYGPMSRTDPNRRKLEVVLAVLMLVLNLALFVTKMVR